MKIRFSKKLIVIMAGVIAIISILVLGGISMMREINEEQSVSIDRINAIQVNMTSVGLHIIRAETGNEVKANLHGKAMQEIKVVTETANNTLSVKVQRKHENLPLYEDVSLDVYIPKEYTKELTIKTLSGDVKMDSFNLASFTLDSSSGKLDAEQLKADQITMNTSSGNLDIKKLEANRLEITGKSSSVNIDECIAGATKIETSSGEVLVSYMESDNQNINIATSSGSVTVVIPGTAGFLVEAKTSSGRFQSDFPINVTDKNDIKGQIGTSNSNILLQTSSGSIKLLKK